MTVAWSTGSRAAKPACRVSAPAWCWCCVVATCSHTRSHGEAQELQRARTIETETTQGSDRRGLCFKREGRRVGGGQLAQRTPPRAVSVAHPPRHACAQPLWTCFWGFLRSSGAVLRCLNCPPPSNRVVRDDLSAPHWQLFPLSPLFLRVS